MDKNVAVVLYVSTHMPLARHDDMSVREIREFKVSTHMPLARHDEMFMTAFEDLDVSTHMPLTRHDPSFLPIAQMPKKFLLTCLLRGMTG